MDHYRLHKVNGLEEETARNSGTLVKELIQRLKERSAASLSRTGEMETDFFQKSNKHFQSGPFDLEPGSLRPVQKTPEKESPPIPGKQLLQGKMNTDFLKAPEKTGASGSLTCDGLHKNIIGVEKQSKLLGPFSPKIPAYCQGNEVRRGRGNIFPENLKAEPNGNKMIRESNKMTVKLPEDLITFMISSGVIFKYQVDFRNFNSPVFIELGSDLVLFSESSYGHYEALAAVEKDLSVKTVKLWGAAAVPPDLDRVKEALVNACNQASRDGLRANVRFFTGLEGNTVTKVRLVGFSDTVDELNEILQDHLTNWITAEEPLRLPHPELVEYFDKFMGLIGMTQTRVTLKASHLPRPHVLLSGPRCKIQAVKQTLASVVSDTLVLDGLGAQCYFQAEGKVSKEMIESLCKVFITVQKGGKHPKVLNTSQGSSTSQQHQTDSRINKGCQMELQGWCRDVFALRSLSHNRGKQAVSGSDPTDLQEVSVSLSHGVKLQLVFGSITDETTDVVVNSTNFRDFHGTFEPLSVARPGGVCNAILSAAGRHLEALLTTAQVKRGTVFVTPPGLFPCKAIFHVHGRQKTHIIDKLVHGIIQQCESHRYKSVAIPAICAGAAGLDPQAVASTILQAIKTATSSTPLLHLSNIRLVLIESSLFLTFKQQLQQIFPQDVTSAELFLQCGDLQRKQALDLLSSSSTGEQSVFFFLGLRRNDVDNAMDKMKDLYQDHCATKSFPKEDLAYLTEADVKALQELLKTEALSVQEDSQGGLEVSGLKVGVDKVAQMLQTTIPLRREMKIKEEESLSAHVTWCILDHYGQWQELPKASSHDLEKGNVSKGIVDKQGNQWTVDLQRMEANRNIQTAILKRLENRTGFTLPLYWDNMTTEENLRVVLLQPNSPEYRTVHGSFKQTANNTVTKIERLQNVHLRCTYEVQKQIISEKNKGQGAIERLLFHGTSPDTCDAIMNYGFNRSFSGKNGTSLGHGTYFAVSASYSVSYAKRGADGHQTMFLTRVLTGSYTQGHHGLKCPPHRGSHDLYDSVVDRTDNPSMFVVFSDNQAYPDYRITFY